MKHEFSSLLIDAVKLGYLDVVKYLIEVAKVELGLPVPRNDNDATMYYYRFMPSTFDIA